MGVFLDARAAKRALSGLLCIYKPAGVPMIEVMRRLKYKICEGLNGLEQRPTATMIRIEGPTNSSMVVKQVPNLADDVRVAGPRYLIEEIKTSFSTSLGRHTSGVLLVGVNEGTFLTYHLHNARLTRAFRVKGELGRATDTYFTDGKTIEKATYKKVTKEKMDRISSFMQSVHQKEMYKMCGVDLQSQAAYDLAEKGPLRPANGKQPIIYGIKCVEFAPPFFTLEIHSVSESEDYLKQLVHRLGLELRSVAHCTGLQCIREGRFSLEHALLSKHWTVPFLLDNIQQNNEILDENMELLKPQSAALS